MESEFREVFTIGGMFSLASHTVPREVFAIPNSAEMKQALQHHDVPVNMDYETPPGQRPTMNSFLLWVAKLRSIAGAGLWTSVPFYLAAVDDPQACRKAVELLDERFGWGLDYADLDAGIEAQNQRTRMGHEDALPEGRLLTLDDYLIHVIAIEDGCEHHEHPPRILVLFQLADSLPWFGGLNELAVGVEVESGKVFRVR